MTPMTRRLIDITLEKLQHEIELATENGITAKTREARWEAANMEARTLAELIETRNLEQQPLI